MLWLLDHHLTAPHLKTLHCTALSDSCLPPSPPSTHNLALYRLYGPIPDNFGQLPYLTAVDLSDNVLTGPLPSSVFSLASLKELSLEGNHLTGTLPSSLRCV